MRYLCTGSYDTKSTDSVPSKAKTKAMAANTGKDAIPERRSYDSAIQHVSRNAWSSTPSPSNACRGFRVHGSGLKLQGSGLRVQGSGFRVQGSGFRVQGSGFRVQGLGPGFRVCGSWFTIHGVGCRV